MAHPEQREFLSALRRQFPEMFLNVSVVEMGSLNVNGTVRDFFDSSRYLGVDVGPGPDVDLVAQGQDVDLPDDDFDVAISAECFEHNPEWAATFANMHRLAKRYVIFTCASKGRPEHGTRRCSPGSSPLTAQQDYYRNLNEKDFRDAFDLDAMFSEYRFDYNPLSQDLYFYGIKA
jgi:SAM-dependent methyltransferase